MTRLLLVLAVLSLLAVPVSADRLHLPVVASTCPVQKGVGGPVDAAQMAQIGATWRHNWSLCTDTRFNPPNPGAECVSWIQWLDQYGSWITTQQWLYRELRTWECPSGWIGFGDEWRLWDYYDYQGDWPMERMVYELHAFERVVHRVAPQCKIVFGGFLVWHFRLGEPLADWFPQFYAAYLAEYGRPPPVDAIGLDNYEWRMFLRVWHQDTRAVVDSIRATFGPDVEIWYRETGALTNVADVQHALDNLGAVVPFCDRWAWFVGYAPSWWVQSAFTADGVLTATGTALADVPACPPKPISPP